MKSILDIIFTILSLGLNKIIPWMWARPRLRYFAITLLVVNELRGLLIVIGMIKGGVFG